MIQEALFGRLKIEKCLKHTGESDLNLKDTKVIGCFADIKPLISSQCGGKQQCDVPIAKIDEETPCYSYLRYYLEATYSCLKG